MRYCIATVGGFLFAIISTLQLGADDIYLSPVATRCIEKGMLGILSNSAPVDTYIGIDLVTSTVIGPAYRGMNQSDRSEFASAIRIALKRGLQKLSDQLTGANVFPKTEKTSGKNKDFHGITGFVTTRSGTRYSFVTNGYLTPSRCQFYTLQLEGLFNLRSWLQQQIEVVSLFQRYGIKQ